MTHYDGEYSGAALQSFLLALGDSKAVIERVLRRAGVDQIDADRWYEFNWAVSIYRDIGAELGRAVLISVGRRMIDAATFPPGIHDVQGMLESLDAAYRLNARGPKIGAIKCIVDDDGSVALDWSTPFPCALSIGIIEGCCNRFGVRALVEHGATGCVDRGGSTCIYRVSL